MLHVNYTSIQKKRKERGKTELERRKGKETGRRKEKKEKERKIFWVRKSGQQQDSPWNG